MNFLNNAFVLSVSIVGLAGCGGSSDGGGTAPGVGNNIFTSFSNIPDNGTTIIAGTSRGASYIAENSDGTGKVTVSSVSGPDDATAAVRTKNGNTVALSVNAPGANVSFDSENGDILGSTEGFLSLTSADGQKDAGFRDPEAAGFEYQTYGSWLTGLGTGSGNVGVGSFGARTASGSLPSGTATYEGGSTGVAVDGSGEAYITGSIVTVSTDFSTAEITSNFTKAVNLNTDELIDAPNINFTGSGPVSGSGFKASVAGSSVSGSADGQFYGPNAQEVGGTFGLAGSGITYSGAFGAKQ